MWCPECHCTHVAPDDDESDDGETHLCQECLAFGLVNEKDRSERIKQLRTKRTYGP